LSILKTILRRKTISLYYLRWVLLILYALVIIGLVAMAVSSGAFTVIWGSALSLIVFVAIQATFLLCADSFNLCKPVRRRRFIYPAVVAGLMMTILLAAIFLALVELLDPLLDPKSNDDLLVFAFFTTLTVSWIGWGLFFFIHFHRRNSFQSIKGLTRTILTGSLISLLINVPSHIIVSRRHQCFAGFATMIGVIAGLCVMLWAFGPGLVLLFLRNKYLREIEDMNESDEMQINDA
jgi:hypothetical protein